MKCCLIVNFKNKSVEELMFWRTEFFEELNFGVNPPQTREELPKMRDNWVWMKGNSTRRSRVELPFILWRIEKKSSGITFHSLKNWGIEQLKYLFIYLSVWFENGEELKCWKIEELKC